MTKKTSVITLVNGREKALNNLINGLNCGTKLPDELIVVFMNEDFYQLPSVNFQIVPILVTSEEKYPLASARNLGAKSASFENLIFLDVDCIPEKTLVEVYLNNIGNELCSGAVRYLSEEAMDILDFEKLHELSSPDPIRSNLLHLSYELFWSLNFACRKAVFEEIGGFNELYKGYGAEDTDFAFRARRKQIKLKRVDATAYHQYHSSYNPPVNHLNSIVNNANLFHQIWNKWPMEGWLKSFLDMGLIDWDQTIKVLRQPSKEEVLNAKKETT